MIYRYIYKITCTQGSFKDHFYYGQHTTKNINDGYKGSGKKIGDYYKKYPYDYIKEIICFCNTSEELNDKEKEIIKYNINNPLCLNLIVTYKTNFKNNEQKKSISDKAKERWNNKDFKDKMKKILKDAMNKNEVRKKISKSAKIRANTDEYKERVSKQLKGHIVKEETKQKLSEAAKKQWQDPNKRKKLFDSLKGKTPWNKGLKIQK